MSISKNRPIRRKELLYSSQELVVSRHLIVIDFIKGNHVLKQLTLFTYQQTIDQGCIQDRSSQLSRQVVDI